MPFATSSSLATSSNALVPSSDALVTSSFQVVSLSFWKTRKKPPENSISRAHGLLFSTLIKRARVPRVERR